MTNGRTATPAALGKIGLGADGHPRGLSPKLDSVGDDPNERFYMLATFCFDLSRKLKYISLALQEFYGDTPPEFARMIRDHGLRIKPRPDTPWEQMAVEAEKVMIELYAEVERGGYSTILNELADQGKP